MLDLMNDLKKYEPRYSKKIKSTEEAPTNAEKLCNNRNNVIKAFEDEVFPFSDGFQKKESVTSDKSLPNCVKGDKERFNETKN